MIAIVASVSLIMVPIVLVYALVKYWYPEVEEALGYKRPSFREDVGSKGPPKSTLKEQTNETTSQLQNTVRLLYT